MLGRNWASLNGIDGSTEGEKLYKMSPDVSSQNCTLRSVRRLLVTANAAPSSPILVTLMMEELSSSETSVLTRATWCNIPEDVILYSHRRENLIHFSWTLQIRKTFCPSWKIPLVLVARGWLLVEFHRGHRKVFATTAELLLSVGKRSGIGHNGEMLLKDIHIPFNKQDSSIRLQ
jgi:hypothetical protein